MVRRVPGNERHTSRTQPGRRIRPPAFGRASPQRTLSFTLSEMGEIGENAPNEANFDETISIAEAQKSIQLTADSGARPGLDNGVAQPGKLTCRVKLPELRRMADFARFGAVVGRDDHGGLLHRI